MKKLDILKNLQLESFEMVLVFDEMDEHDDDNAWLMVANESSDDGDVWNGIGDLDVDGEDIFLFSFLQTNLIDQQQQQQQNVLWRK